VKQLLVTNTSPTNCSNCGSGEVNAAKAVNAARAATIIHYTVMPGTPTNIDASPMLEYLVRGSINTKGQVDTFNVKVPPMSRITVDLSWTSQNGPRDLELSTPGSGTNRPAGDKPESVILFNLTNAPVVSTVTVKDVDANPLTSSLKYKLRLYDEAWTAPAAVVKSFYVAKLYTEGMERNPDYDGFVWQMNALNSKPCGTPAFKDLALGFLNSSEFISKHPTNSSKVNALYRAVLAREPDTAGYNWWLDKLNTGAATWTDVVGGFFTTGGEFDTKLAPVYCSTNNT
jgi:hypothetical protein